MRKIASALAMAGAAALVFAAPAPALVVGSDGGSRGPLDFDWWGFGGCSVPVLVIPTDYENVAPDIPPEHREKLIRVGYGEEGQVGLLVIVVSCPQTRLETAGGNTIDHGAAVEVLIGVGYESAILSDLPNPQFYALASLNDWGAWAAAEQAIGLPARHTAIDAVFNRDPITGLGSWNADVDWTGSPFTIVGSIAAPNFLRDFQQDAIHYYDGQKGFVRVHHDEAWAPGNEVTSTIVAPDPASDLARWMGSTTRDAQGVYVWIHDHQHVHRYEILEGH